MLQLAFKCFFRKLAIIKRTWSCLHLYRFNTSEQELRICLAVQYGESHSMHLASTLEDILFEYIGVGSVPVIAFSTKDSCADGILESNSPPPMETLQQLNFGPAMSLGALPILD